MKLFHVERVPRAARIGLQQAFFRIGWAFLLLHLAIIPAVLFAQTTPASITKLVKEADSRDPGNSGRIPLILIHGNHGTADDEFGMVNESHGQGYFSYFIDYFYQSDLANKFVLYRFHYRSDVLSVREIAQGLGHHLITMLGETQIAIVAHSMGGLVARSYMEENGGGDKVLRLLTLGTPHHGSPAANDAARTYLLAGEMELTAALDLIDVLTWWKMDQECSAALALACAQPDPVLALVSLLASANRCHVLVDEPSRADLRWDNYNHLEGDYEKSKERNDWLKNLNNSARYTRKVFAYACTIDRNDPLFVYLSGLSPNEILAAFARLFIDRKMVVEGGLKVYQYDEHTKLAFASVLLEQIYRLTNDGLVPIDSGQFFRGDIGKKVLLQGYDHLDIVAGKEDRRNELFDLLREDLQDLAASPVLNADFHAQPTSGQPPLTVQFASLATAVNTTISRFQWDFNGDGVVDSELENPFWTYNDPGLYTVTLIVADASMCAQESKKDLIYVANSYEPNNSFSTATPIQPGVAGVAQAIEAENDQDYFRFDAVQGYGYTVRLEGESDVDVQFYLFDHLGKLQSSSWGTNQFSYICTVSGVNYVQVVRAGGSKTGQYSLLVLPAYWNSGPLPSWDRTFEPNPHSYQALLLKTQGTSYSSTISKRDDEDWYRFTAARGNTYTLRLSGEAGVGVTFVLHYENEKHELERISSQWGTDAYEFTCSHSGSYVVQVYRDGGADQGDYTFNVSAAVKSQEVSLYPQALFTEPGENYRLYAVNSNGAALRWSSSNNSVMAVDQSGRLLAGQPGMAMIRAVAADNPANYDESAVYVLPANHYEPNNTYSTATPIAAGVECQAHAIDAASDVDFLQFTARQGQGYTIVLENETGVGVNFVLYDHLQKPISSSWGSDNVQYFCSVGGTNYIRVQRDGGREDGYYTVRVIPAYWDSSPRPEWDENWEPDPGSYSAPLLATDGTAYFNTIHSGGDTDWFRFTAESGASYTISLGEEVGSGVTFVLYFENENHELERISSQWGSDIYEFNCAHTGCYMINVSRDGGLSEGDYKLSIIRPGKSHEVSLFPNTLFLHPGESTFLTASSSANHGFHWSSQSGSTAVVSQNGLVKALQPGVSSIRAAALLSATAYDTADLFVLPANEFEPNNSFSTATEIQVGTVFQPHSINSAGDVDYLRFNAVQGEGYTVMLEHEMSCGVNFILYDHRQQAISSSWGSDIVSYFCTASGPNFIRVQRDGGREDGYYTVRVLPAFWNDQSAPQWDQVFEPNPHWLNAPLVATDGTAIFSTIASAGDEDNFRFTAARGRTYTISLAAERGSGAAFVLYHANQQYQLERISSQWGSDAFEFLCAHSGSYIITVYRDGGLSEGDYRLSVISPDESHEISLFPYALFMQPGETRRLAAATSSGAAVHWSSSDPALVSVREDGTAEVHQTGHAIIKAEAADDPAGFDTADLYIYLANLYEPNNSFSTATRIAVGQSFQTHTLGQSNDVDYIQFTAVKEQGYTVMLENELGAGVNFVLFDPKQQAISSSWGSNIVSWICAETGTHYIRVQRDGGREDGFYTIRVVPAYWNRDPWPGWDDNNEPNPHWFNAPLLASDGTRYFNKIESANDEDYFRFNASAGVTYTISLDDEKSSSVAFVLYSESERHELAAISSTWGSDLYEFTCINPGTCIIKVYRDGGLTEGDYQLSIINPLETAVKLTGFSARQIDDEIIVSWMAPQADEVLGYEIEKNRENSWDLLVTLTAEECDATGCFEVKDKMSSYSVLDAPVQYRIRERYRRGTYACSEPITVELKMPEKCALLQNYPNPFNPVTEIGFQVSKTSRVILQVYDLLGREVDAPVDQEYRPGKYKIRFDGTGLPSGLYFYKIRIDHFTAVRRMLLLE